MIIVTNNSVDPAFNLALEEVLLKEYNDDVFMLWQNERAVIVGCNQNTAAEINAEAVREHNVKVVRRLTGGGAVYHDLGNLNFTFIMRNAKEKFLDFGYFNAPLLRLLHDYGFDAVSSVRNDILVGDKKISGNAQKIHKDSVIHHGTLLFGVSMEILAKVLNPNPLKIQSKAISSVKSRVANLNDLRGEKINISRFKSDAVSAMLELNPDSGFIEVENEPELYGKVMRLKIDKYDTWEWNYGESPRYSIEKASYSDSGLIEVKMNVEAGRISQIKFYGDFSGMESVDGLEKSLTGVKREYAVVLNELKKLDVCRYIKNADAESVALLIAD